jgi:hypothetical protein
MPGAAVNAMRVRNPLIHGSHIKRRRIIRWSIAAVALLLALASVADHLRGSDWRFDGRWFIVTGITEDMLIELAPEQGGKVTRVRLLGLPGPGEDWSMHAREHGLARLAGRRVLLRLEPMQSRDDAGQLQGYLYMDDRNVNVDLVQQGQARMDRGPKHTFAGAMAQAESAARRKRLGVWARAMAIEDRR